MAGGRLSLVALAACLSVAAGCAVDGEHPAASYSDATVRTTMTIPSHAVKVVAVGDISCPPGDPVTATTCQQAATAAQARSIGPRVVLALGDLQYDDGRLADFQASYDASWGTLKSVTKPLPGNHDYRTAGADGYYSYFGGKPPGYRATTIGSSRCTTPATPAAMSTGPTRPWRRSGGSPTPITSTWRWPDTITTTSASTAWTATVTAGPTGS